MKIGQKALLAAIGAFALMGGVVPWSNVSAAAQPPANQQSSTGIIRYSAQNPNVPHLVVTGVKVAGGCRFVLGGNGPAPTSTQFQETAYDPATCQSFIDEVPAQAAAAASTPASQSAGGGQASGNTDVAAAPAAIPKCANPARDTHHSYSHDNCIDSWFQDVVGKHLTEVRNEVQWNPANGCASYGRAFASWYATWLANDGWYEVFSHFEPSFSCSGVRSALLDSNISGNYGIEFENDIFCMLSETTTWFASQITGKANGSYSWSVGWEKVGACEALLSWHAQAS